MRVDYLTLIFDFSFTVVWWRAELDLDPLKSCEATHFWSPFQISTVRLRIACGLLWFSPSWIDKLYDTSMPPEISFSLCAISKWSGTHLFCISNPSFCNTYALKECFSVFYKFCRSVGTIVTFEGFCLFWLLIYYLDYLNYLSSDRLSIVRVFAILHTLVPELL